LKLYKDLGGKILTIGSDTHVPKHLAAYVSETMAKLREMGFETICTFQNMKPQYHKL